MTMPLTPGASVARVTQQGPCCPVCQHDTQLLYDSLDMEGPTILQEAMRPACGARWRDVYPLSGYVLYALDDVVPASGYVMHTSMVSRTDDPRPVDGTPGGQRHAPQT